MFKKMEIVKINDKLYNMYDKDGDKKRKYIIKSPQIYLPFGIEKYNNKYVINMEIRNSDEFSELLYKIDNYFRGIESICGDDIGDREYYSNIKKRDKYDTILLRGNLKKGKNVIITEIKDSENNILSINDIKPGDKVEMYLEVNSIWLNDKQYGIYYEIKRIVKIIN